MADYYGIRPAALRRNGTELDREKRAGFGQETVKFSSSPVAAVVEPSSD
jgi:hypothetical protein